MFRLIERIIERTGQNLASYSEMRPDFRLRSRINRSFLGARSPMSAEDWFEHFWRQRGMVLPVVRFVYAHLADYSGLWWDRILPSDRLNEDLHLPLVCWFDWEMSLLDDLSNELGIAIEDPELLAQAVTVEDFLTLLNQQFLQAA